MNLTDHLSLLCSLDSYQTATRHEFLSSAGNGTLDQDRLALWLAQDRIYAAHAYPRFIGALISKIPFKTSDHPESAAEVLNRDILKTLTFCLQNIVAEVDFFKSTAERYDLDINKWPERKETRDYTAEMARVSLGGSLQDGLIFLWAMEKVYLDAWIYVRHELETAVTEGSTTFAAVSALSKNWSSPEFIAFVDDLTKIVNNLGIALDSADGKRAAEVFARVVELEIMFWP
ncbi:heme oxygenase-like protein [Mycena floridula]|nr:heme oxygenase-like protein [Mycena floridula]